MTLERRLAFGEKFVDGHVSQTPHFGRILGTHFPEFDIKTTIATSPTEVDELRKKMATIGPEFNFRDPIKTNDGRFILIDAPSKVGVHSFEKPHKESQDSDAIYLAEYKTENHLFLLQWLNGATSRHEHPQSLEAFSVISGNYYVHNESLGRTVMIPEIKNRVHTIHQPNTDHQCFTTSEAALVAIVMSGSDFEHKHIAPRMTKEQLWQKAMALENGQSPRL